MSACGSAELGPVCVEVSTCAVSVGACATLLRHAHGSERYLRCSDICKRRERQRAESGNHKVQCGIVKEACRLEQPATMHQQRRGFAATDRDKADARMLISIWFGSTALSSFSRGSLP